jgi:hypothetical protein
VTVTANSLNSSVPYTATSTTAGGSYAFNNAPSGVQIEIKVAKPGYTTRRRVEVLKSNKEGNPDANKYDFGAGVSSNGSASNALSDKPEVTVVTPGRNAAGVSPTSSFVLKFSEPMDRATVVDNFEVRAFTSEKLSVDTSGANFTVTGSTSVDALGDTRIWDKAAFNISWNSDDSEATFTFKEERMLPTDKDTDKVPDYQISLERQDKNIKDKSGITRSTDAAITGGGIGAFKITEGNFERTVKFSISADTTRPRLDSVTAQTAENSGSNSDGDAIKVRFTERMIHYTLGPTIAGGMGGVTSQAAGANNALLGTAVAPNYKVTVIRAGTTLLNQTTWGALGGSAIFDTNDPTHKTVLLLPGSQTDVQTIAGDPTGQTITLTQFYTDGTSRVFNSAPVANTPASVGGALLATLDPDGGQFTGMFNDNITANGLTEAGETYVLTLAANAFENDGLAASTTGRRIASLVIDRTGAFSATALNAPAGGFRLFPGATAGGRPNLYQPGDNVIVMIDTTVLDPAGNSIDSSGDDASANAS